jgi:hypothetical protein
MREFWLQPEPHLRELALANAPCVVHCESPQVAAKFRFACYREKRKNPAYAEIELVIKEKSVLFLPKERVDITQK